MYCSYFYSIESPAAVSGTDRSSGTLKDADLSQLQCPKQLLHEANLDVIGLKGKWELVWNFYNT